MNIIRQIQPNGMPFIVDVQADDDGKIIRNTVRVFPIIPSDPPRIGENVYTYATPKGKHEKQWLSCFPRSNNNHRKPKKDDETN